MKLDPASAALYALIALCLVILGALITPGVLTADQRGPVLAGVVTVLFAIAWRSTRHPPREGD
jgi:branched-subunit amino acid transport protein